MVIAPSWIIYEDAMTIKSYCCWILHLCINAKKLIPIQLSILRLLSVTFLVKRFISYKQGQGSLQF